MLTSSWGRFPTVDAQWKTFDDEKELHRVLESLAPGKSAIARGLGRSYGDSSLADTELSTRRLNRFISFDETTGELVCESGISLADILEVFVPRGWFLPVTPGTKFVTVGGAIASDVHGKNHHREGSFSNHVRWLDLILADGSSARCSSTENTELFLTTCAGYGLTGIVIQAAIRLKKIETAYIRQKTIKARNLEEAISAFDEYSGWTYSVAWIDCLSSGGKLGRSVLMLGEHAKKEEATGTSNPLKPKSGKKFSVPMDFPSFVLNSLTVRGFNSVYYGKARGGREELISYEPFFYPLDGIHNWNRIYGKRGFVQYQMVIPKEAGREGLKEILEKVSASGRGSFLAVLKLFGKEDAPYLSFAKEGYTLALDFAVSPSLQRELEELDAIVRDLGGRIYPTKDARMSPEMMKCGYPELDKFRTIREKVDPHRRFSSLQSRRLEL